MREIDGHAKTVRELLKDTKYSIDYYQRDYRWGGKQIRELIDDLTNKFLEEHDSNHPREEVAKYPHYFLGSVILSQKDRAQFIIDGQQRLTSLTLLLVFLRNLQRDHDEQVGIDDLIVSVKYGHKSFNINVDERIRVMEALFEGEPFDTTDQPDSVRNLYQRYLDIDEAFPDELREAALPYFIDWLLDNVHLVEITAYSDEDAYTIFETMNDRGLSLTQTEMLKGYLLANISNPTHRANANDKWRARIKELNDTGKDTEPDFFKAWLRSQYATKIRERRRGATAEDFDRIGTEYHRWLRDAAPSLNLSHGDDYSRFIERNFSYYSRHYLRLMQASQGTVDNLEHVLYNADRGFTLQYMLLLAPLTPEDSDETATLKVRLMAQFLDILITWRQWNFRSIAYSTMQYAMFLVMREARGLDPQPLARMLHDRLQNETENLETPSSYHQPGIGLYLHQQNRRALHHILARLTDYVETSSGLPSQYRNYTNAGSTRYEVEHIWANTPERHQSEFTNPNEFHEHRNRLGGLLLLPKSFNASYGAKPYETKLPHYRSQNLLAGSLHPDTYEHNPGFLSFIRQTDLPFKAHTQFDRADLDERHELYRQIAKRIWNPEKLLQEVNNQPVTSDAT